MRIAYVMAVWVHILTVSVWIGAMIFEDPKSVRMTSRIVDRMGGIGWYAQAALWSTGLLMLKYRRVALGHVFSAAFMASSWGRALWAKLVLVLVLAAFQVLVGHKPSKLVYGYILVAVLIVGISVILVRPIVF
jgi:uncharacterized membrane protein